MINHIHLPPQYKLKEGSEHSFEQQTATGKVFSLRTALQFPFLQKHPSLT